MFKALIKIVQWTNPNGRWSAKSGVKVQLDGKSIYIDGKFAGGLKAGTKVSITTARVFGR
jgi:hypothetical protein